MSELLNKEKEVIISRLKHNILEDELKLLKKEEEVKRLKEEIKKSKERLDNEMSS